MTAEELIIGHYEKTLTSEQESRLASMVETSPDVRTLFEQHGNIQGLMVSEAGTIETSSKLDKVVLGAALGTLVEIAGHGVGFSLIGKVASVIGALGVGAASFILYQNMQEPDAATPQPTQATSPAQNGTAPTPPQLDARTTETPVVDQPAVDAPVTTETPSGTTNAVSSTGTDVDRPTKANEPANSGTPDRSGVHAAAPDNGDLFNDTDDTATVEGKTKVIPQPKK